MKSSYILPHPPIILPEVGKGEEKRIRRTAEGFETVARRIAEERPETIVIVSPHNVMFRDAFYVNPGERETDDMRRFGCGASVTYTYDTELRDEILRLCAERDIPTVSDARWAGRPDHGSVLPLLFLNRYYSCYRVVRLSPSLLPDENLLEMGRILDRAAANTGRKISIIASGDLSHKLLKEGPYGFAPEGLEFDRRITEAMAAGDFAAFRGFDPDFLDRAAECGLQGFILLSGALEGYETVPDFLSYEGPFGVGYAVCAFGCTDRCVRLARSSVEQFVRIGKMMKRPEGLPARLTRERAGVFVSIHENGELRGCIGTIGATQECIADEIIALAVEAATRDPRFPPIRETELGDLEISVDILSEAEPADETMLDPKRFGVIVSSGRRRGLLLPNLEGVDTVCQQVAIARRKAGIPADMPYSLERFCVERHT